MRSWRILGFALAIVIGLVAGLLAGWLLFPSADPMSSPANLRTDYKADYVLMTAEIYHQDGDLAAAGVRLGELGEDDPIHAVQSAILTAQELGYAQPDMQLLASLFTGLQTYTPVPMETQP